MDIIKFDEAKKIWKKAAKFNSSGDFSFELEVHKKLLSIFHIGEYYYYIFNVSNSQVEYVSASIRQILGIHENDITAEYLFNHIHPEDRSYFIDFESKVTSFFNQLAPEKVLKYKVSYDYRVKKNDGQYIRILQQVTTIQSDKNGSVLRVLGVHTDISHLKKTNGSTLSFIGLDGEPSYTDVYHGFSNLEIKKGGLSKREKEVLRKLAEGKKSAEVAEELFISLETVNTHRRNMLRKTNTHSILELVLKSIHEL